ncbi:MAG: hypothetical protein ACR2F1_02190 [Nitrososphaeraceae archaeon]
MTNKNDSYFVPFNLTDDLKKEDIIQEFGINTNLDVISLILNHKYKETKINSSIIFNKNGKYRIINWSKTSNQLEFDLNKNGISNKHIKIIYETLNWNNNALGDIYGKEGSKQEYEILKEEEEKEEKRLSNADKLAILAKENIELLFKDQHNDAFAFIRVKNSNVDINYGKQSDDNESNTTEATIEEIENGNSKHDQFHFEVTSLRDKKMRLFLSNLYHSKYNKVINAEAISNVLTTLEAWAIFKGKTFPLHLRVTWTNPKIKDSILYDLTDDNWKCIKITKNNSWEIIHKIDYPVFKRFHESPQVLPDKAYDHNIMNEFLDLTNIKESDNRLLTGVWIISTIIPYIPHPLFNIKGQKGGAKSTSQTLIKSLIDPSIIETLTVTSDKSEFIQQLDHNYIAFYDNLKVVPNWLAEEICKAVTGAGSSKRELYTVDNDFIRKYRRIIGFNSINVVFDEPDVIDRSINIDTDRIKPLSRKLEEEIYTKFEMLKPKLLGYIFDIVSKTLKIKDDIKSDLKNLPRMADFAVWGEAISTAMGNEPLEFIKAYYRNIGKQNVEVVDAHPLAKAILISVNELEEIFQKNDSNSNANNIDEERIEEIKNTFHFESNSYKWVISTTKYLQTLNNIANDNNLDTYSKLWSKTPNKLSHSLRELSSNLLEGYNIDIKVRNSTTKDDVSKGYKKNSSIVEIRKIKNTLFNYDTVGEEQENEDRSK